MKKIYEKPEAELINFHALENLAVIEDAENGALSGEGGVASRDFG